MTNPFCNVNYLVNLICVCVYIYIYIYIYIYTNKHILDFPNIYLLPMQEMQSQSLDLEDTLEKEMATHSSIFAWETPWTEEPDGLQSMGSQKS